MRSALPVGVDLYAAVSVSVTSSSALAGEGLAIDTSRSLQASWMTGQVPLLIAVVRCRKTKSALLQPQHVGMASRAGSCTIPVKRGELLETVGRSRRDLRPRKKLTEQE